MKIKITPVDMLFFRNARPFEKGVDTWAESLLLPNYSTIYGALRTAYIAEYPEAFDLLDTDKDPTADIRIKRVGYYYKNSLYYPAPADLVLDSEKESVKTKKEKLDNVYSGYHLCKDGAIGNANNLLGRYGLKAVYVAPDGLMAERLPGACIEVGREMRRYAAGKDPIGMISINRCIQKEIQTGIALKDATRTTGDGLLYRKEKLRYKDFSIVVEFTKGEDEKPLPDKGWLKFGTDVAFYETYDKDMSPALDLKNPVETSEIKIVLGSPAIFKNGWIPDCFDPATLEGTIDIGGISCKASLTGAIVGGYRIIGGFDMKKLAEKPMHRAVPEGSIYSVSLDRTITLSQNMIELNLESELSQEGYGLAWLLEDKL